jgi:hypothetical protein
MKSVLFSKAFLLAGLMLLSIFACYGQDDSSVQVEGTWTKSMNERPITFTLTSDLTYQVEFAGDEETDVWGSYTISGTNITFTDEGGEYSSGVSGEYEFEVSDTTISFTEVDDPVNGRRMLVEGNWSKAAAVEK